MTQKVMTSDKQAERLQWLEQQIAQAQDAYYNGEAVMEDGAYDLLMEELAAINTEHPLLVKVGAEPVSEWKKEKHLFQLGSLYKVNTAEQIENWIEETLEGRSVVVSEKLDGLSLGCRYDKGELVSAILRGNGLEGENILVNVLKMQGVVNSVPNFTGVVRGEIILTKSNLAKHFPDYANPRNAASGLCRRLDGEGCQHLSFIAYQVFGNGFTPETETFDFLQTHQFLVPHWQECRTPEEVITLWQEYQDSKRDGLDYEIDGLVMACNDILFQMGLGSTNLRAKGKMAIKFPNQLVQTTVKEVRWEVGNMGRVNPVCWFDEVDLFGAKVQKASAYNMDYIEKLGIGVGAEILCTRAGEIIPRVEKVIKAAIEVAKAPTECPLCGTAILEVGKYLTCPNQDCGARVSGRIKNWVKELDLLELGEKVIDKLIEAGLVETVADLYCLSVKEISELERMGERSAENIINSIWKQTTIGLDVFLGALSIPLIGQATIKLLMADGFDTLEKINGMSVEEMLFVKGMGNARANSLYQGLRDNAELIEELLENGIQIRGKKMEETTKKKLYGKSFVFTGTATHPRKVLQQMVEDNGGTNRSSVSKEVSYLVCEDATTTKSAKAQKLGVAVINEEEFLEMIE